MAESHRGTHPRQSEQKADPTVTGKREASSEYPEGTHPVRSPSEGTWSGDRLKYADMPDKDKPDKSSIVQTVEDPMDDDIQKAVAADAKSAQSQPSEAERADAANK